MLSLTFAVIGRILAWLINAYITVLFIRMILDWVSLLARNWYPRGVVAQLINAVYTVTEPPLRWLRQYIRPLPLGGMYLDISFIVLYFLLVALESVIMIIF
ncbi:YggT family protein [Bifidobacterium sp. SO4]|uniref:YggT family protein n=1 Tax=Bifidobacterium sp. SO4 TaxID=2809030 RepID=UPI001BDC6F2D|nr:YggT family protein [Bifidobacterium sp. SO4]MBT1171667.1 YggT family protein [Bifidobacterium sp. SO4]